MVPPLKCNKKYFLLLKMLVTCFLLVARSHRTIGSRNIKQEVVFKVQKMARYASFGLIMGPFKG